MIALECSAHEKTVICIIVGTTFDGGSMFIRWKRRAKVRNQHCPYVRYAVLVESERVDGKPRQRVVRYLAHIGETYLGETAHQQYFWERVDWHLDDLSLDQAVRQKVVAALLEVVARPCTSDLEQLERRRRALSQW